MPCDRDATGTPGAVRVDPPPAADAAAWAALAGFCRETLHHELPPDALARLARFHEWHRGLAGRLNLTRLLAPDDFIWKQCADSLAAAAVVPALRRRPLRVLDVGSGGGFPGLVLAAVFGALAVTLLERTGKKARALAEARALLGLTVAVEARNFAEFAARDHPRFDLVALRAVECPERLAPRFCRVLAPGGRVLFFRPPTAARDGPLEAALARAGFERPRTRRVTIPDPRGAWERRLLLFRRGTGRDKNRSMFP